MRVTAILITLALTGCAAHSSMMRQGDRAVRHGQWEQAVAAYAEAQKLSPGHPKVQARLASAQTSLERDRQQRLDAAVRRFGIAVTQGRWDDAVDARGTAYGIDPVIADALGLDAWETLSPGIRAALRDGRLEDAFAPAMVAMMVHPTDASQRLLTQVNDAIYERVQMLTDAGRWPEALDWVDWMQGAGVPGDHAATRAHVTTEWSSFKAGQAKTAEETGKLASAAVRFHEAFAIDGDRGWLAERDRVARQVEDALRYELRWEAETDPMTRGVQTRVTRALQSNGSIATPTTGDAVGSVDLNVGPARCANVEVAGSEQVQVKVGTRVDPNPDYEPRMRALRQAEDARSTAQAEVTKAEDALTRADRAYRQRVETELAPVQADLTRAQTDVDWARRRVMEAEDALASARAACTDPTVVDPAVARAEADLERAQERLSDAESVASDQQRRLATVERSLSTARSAVDGAERTLSRARGALEGAVRTVAQRVATLDRTPMTVTRDVFEPFIYPVTTVTRTCEWSATMRHQEGGSVERFSLSRREWTKDTWHTSYPSAGVLSDPLAFSRSDADMTAAAQDAFAITVREHVDQRTDAYYAALWDSALEASPTDQSAALDHWLAVLRLHPTTADDIGLAALRQVAGDVGWMRRP